MEIFKVKNIFPFENIEIGIMVGVLFLGKVQNFHL